MTDSIDAEREYLKTRTKAGKKRLEFERVYGSHERVEFVRGLPCCVCLSSRGSDNHHVRTGGTGRKADYTAIVPLCPNCHRRYHRIGKLSMLQAAEGRLYVPVGLEDRHDRLNVFDQWDDAAKAVDDLWKTVGVCSDA